MNGPSFIARFELHSVTPDERIVDGSAGPGELVLGRWRVDFVGTERRANRAR